MNIFEAILLGVVQGLTEFLPVSSSGHLILMRDVLGLNTDGGLAFDAILQLGTILAVFVYFRRDILELFYAAIKFVIGKSKEVKNENRKILLALIVGTIPALILGILLESQMETIFRSSLLVGGMLIAGSILFIVAEKFAPRVKNTTLGNKKSFLIGLFQSLALIPGVSRSGATISGGLLLGLDRAAAARFSFLLSIPIITGSGLKKLWDVSQMASFEAAGYYILTAGFIAAFIVGLICISFLIRFLKNHTLYIFAGYRIVLALIILSIKFW